jgi:hypothetical protein
VFTISISNGCCAMIPMAGGYHDTNPRQRCQVCSRTKILTIRSPIPPCTRIFVFMIRLTYTVSGWVLFNTKWASYVSYIMGRTSYFSMRWLWCLLCIRPTCSIRFSCVSLLNKQSLYSTHYSDYKSPTILSSNTLMLRS